MTDGQTGGKLVERTEVLGWQLADLYSRRLQILFGFQSPRVLPAAKTVAVGKWYSATLMEFVSCLCIYIGHT